MRVLPQQEHCNLGEVDDDRTPDMREGRRLQPTPFGTTTQQSPQPLQEI